MTGPDDFSPARPHPIRNALLLLAGFLVIMFGSAALALYVDWLWFREVRLAHVFRTIVGTKVALGAGAGVICFALVYANLSWAARHPKDHLLSQVYGPGQQMLKNVLERYLGPVVLAASVVLALMAGVKAAARWEDLILLLNATPFGRLDPQLGRDLGFYVFQLPFIHFAQGWLMGNLVLIGVVTAGAYLALGAIGLTPLGPMVNPRAARHLGLLAGAALLVLGWGFQLDVFDTLFSKHGVVTGATYTDVYARIPAYRLLAVASALAGMVVVALSWRGNWKLPVVVAGGVLALSFVGVNLLPGMLQKYRVVPNEIVKEGLFIKRNIEATRVGFGLDAISAEEFPAADSLSAEVLVDNHVTIENVRLWDHKPLLSTYRQLQQIRTYYDFVDVDNDRYRVNGTMRQVMLSPRELSYGNLPGGANWINEHLTYTHGYGVSVGPVNRISQEGLPEFYVKDIPPATQVPALKVTRPEIYYGELANDYVFVRTQAKEFDYPVGDQNQYATYDGKGGVPMSGPLAKLAFALHFGTTKLLFSGDIVPESRIMYHRDIKDRVGMVAPYLIWDGDPYMVIGENGRLVWMLDGYTTTGNLPYSERLGSLGNYIRNSVKAVVDAYDGSIALYIADPDDPIIRTYAKAFPNTYRPLAEMPADIRAHMRYPQDLFAVQAHMLQKYHMLDPQNFYNNEDLWEIPRVGEQPAQPYYTIMKLPGQEHEEFILLLPYTPAKRDNMTAWLAARMDGEHYGSKVVYLFPKQKLIYGPRQIEARIDQDAKISEQLTLWSQMGSSVIRGTLLVIPIEDSLLYIEPLYLAAERGSLPELRRVIVAYGNKLAMEPNLELALRAIFGKGVPVPSGGAAPGGARPPQGIARSESMEDLAARSQDAFNRAQDASRAGDWAAYGEALKELEAALKRMNR
ncbi:MAG: UPF0182 family protein [Nitrospirae bacterium]|nr:UPF0182 family protein [Nitrospirota bacterium]